MIGDAPVRGSDIFVVHADVCAGALCTMLTVHGNGQVAVRRNFPKLRLRLPPRIEPCQNCRPNLPQPEELVKLKGKHRNENNLDTNERTDKNTAGW